MSIKAYKVVDVQHWTDNRQKRVVWAKAPKDIWRLLVNADSDFILHVDEENLKYYRLKEADGLMPEGFVMKWKNYLEVYVDTYSGNQNTK